MNEANPPPDAGPAALRAAPGEPPRRGRRRALLTLIAVALVLAGAYTVLESRRQAQLHRELAETRAREAAAAAAREKAALELAEQAQKKLAELEQVVPETDAGAPVAATSREEALLLEVERLVTLAVHDLQLTRQTATALAALELADARLAAANAPRWAALRRAIGRDLERLRAVPAVDTTGIALKLDQLIAGADVWPLITTAAAPPAKAPAPAKKAEPPAAAKKAEPGAAAKPVEAAPEAPPRPTAWERARQWLLAEFGDLVRIREVATPEALLLDAEQGRLVRQQLKLRLLGGRLALLARNDRLYHADIENAQTLLALYFEGRNPGVAGAAATLRQLNTASLSFDVPALADSQAAVRAARVRRP
jgi:uroporphyrinogen III methyltransferase/synthase